MADSDMDFTEYQSQYLKLLNKLTELRLAGEQLLWFNLNGHFAKNNNYDSEVFHEPKTNQTTLH